MERIENSIVTLTSLGVKVEVPPLDSLTGGYEGTASALITKLDEVLATMGDKLPPTEMQLETLVEMFLCVDIPFEDYGISRRVELEDGLWRKPTPEEFKLACSEVFNKSEASGFIGKYKPEFSKWKLERATIDQIKRIKTLEERLCGDRKPEVQELAIMIDGQTVELTPNRKEYVKGTTYEPLTEEQLMLFDKTTASEYITQLESELVRVNGQVESQHDNTFEFIRVAQSENQAILQEYEEVINLLHQLGAVAGWESEALEAFDMRIIQDDSPEAYKENKEVIRNFMTELIETNAIDFFGLMEFVKDSRSLQRVLLNI